MNALTLILTTFCCTVIWLVLLIATGFSVLAVSAGLLAAVYVLGQS